MGHIVIIFELSTVHQCSSFKTFPIKWWWKSYRKNNFFFCYLHGDSIAFLAAQVSCPPSRTQQPLYVMPEFRECGPVLASSELSCSTAPRSPPLAPHSQGRGLPAQPLPTHSSTDNLAQTSPTPHPTVPNKDLCSLFLIIKITVPLPQRKATSSSLLCGNGGGAKF